MGKNYYHVLGIEKDASDKQIKIAYARLKEECIKEKNAKKFKEINEAFKTLGKSATRKQYDMLGSFEGEAANLLEWAVGYYNKKEYSKAIDYFKRFLKLEPQANIGFNYLAQCYAVLGDLNNAYNILRQVIKKGGDIDEVIYSNITDYTYKLRKYAETEFYLNEGLNKYDSIKLNLSSVRLYYTAKDKNIRNLDKAEKILAEKIIPKIGKEKCTFIQMVNVAVYLGKFELNDELFKCLKYIIGMVYRKEKWHYPPEKLTSRFLHEAEALIQEQKFNGAVIYLKILKVAVNYMEDSENTELIQELYAIATQAAKFKENEQAAPEVIKYIALLIPMKYGQKISLNEDEIVSLCNNSPETVQFNMNLLKENYSLLYGFGEENFREINELALITIEKRAAKEKEEQKDTWEIENEFSEEEENFDENFSASVFKDELFGNGEENSIEELGNPVEGLQMKFKPAGENKIVKETEIPISFKPVAPPAVKPAPQPEEKKQKENAGGLTFTMRIPKQQPVEETHPQPVQNTPAPVAKKAVPPSPSQQPAGVNNANSSAQPAPPKIEIHWNVQGPGVIQPPKSKEEEEEELAKLAATLFSQPKKEDKKKTDILLDPSSGGFRFADELDSADGMESFDDDDDDDIDDDDDDDIEEETETKWKKTQKKKDKNQLDDEEGLFIESVELQARWKKPKFKSKSDIEDDIEDDIDYEEESEDNDEPKTIQALMSQIFENEQEENKKEENTEIEEDANITNAMSLKQLAAQMFKEHSGMENQDSSLLGMQLNIKEEPEKSEKQQPQTWDELTQLVNQSLSENTQEEEQIDDLIDQWYAKRSGTSTSKENSQIEKSNTENKTPAVKENEINMTDSLGSTQNFRVNDIYNTNETDIQTENYQKEDTNNFSDYNSDENYDDSYSSSDEDYEEIAYDLSTVIENEPEDNFDVEEKTNDFSSIELCINGMNAPAANDNLHVAFTPLNTEKIKDTDKKPAIAEKTTMNWQNKITVPVKRPELPVNNAVKTEFKPEQKVQNSENENTAAIEKETEELIRKSSSPVYKVNDAVKLCRNSVILDKKDIVEEQLSEIKRFLYQGDRLNEDYKEISEELYEDLISWILKNKYEYAFKYAQLLLYIYNKIPNGESGALREEVSRVKVITNTVEEIKALDEDKILCKEIKDYVKEGARIELLVSIGQKHPDHKDLDNCEDRLKEVINTNPIMIRENLTLLKGKYSWLYIKNRKDIDEFYNWAVIKGEKPADRAYTINQVIKSTPLTIDDEEPSGVFKSFVHFLRPKDKH